MIQKVKKTFLSILVLIVFQLAIFGQFEKYTAFNQIDSLWIGYMNSNKQDSALLVFEYAKDRFPEKDKEITYVLGYLYALTQKDSLALSMWDYGQRKGYYFALDRYIYNEKLKSRDKYIALAERDKQIGDSLNNLSHIEYDIALPENYSKDRHYPLLFVFHGGGSSKKMSKDMWNSETMTKHSITVYVQSYVIGFRSNYDWLLNDEKTNKEFKDVYESVVNKYSVDKEKIYFLGFSAGGKIAIDYAFKDFVPVSGLVLNSPDVPNITDDLITEFVKANKRIIIIIITGEKDWALTVQKELTERVYKMDGKSKIIVQEGIGHTYSVDFSHILDESLIWISE